MTATASGGLASETIPAPARSAARAASRAAPGLVRRPRENHRRPARIFVRTVIGAGKRAAPQGRPIHEGVRPDPGENTRRNADVGEADRPAERSSRLERMARLQTEKGHCGGRFDRDAAHLARRSVDTRRRVDCKDAATRPRVGVDPLHEGTGFPVDVARQARAEERVDHAGGAVEPDRAGRRDRAVEAHRGGGGVACERAALPEEAQVDREAAPGQQPGGDKAVAPVVAGAADDDDSSARSGEPRRLVGDGEFRRLHERRPASSGSDGHPVRVAHLGRGQEFMAFERVEHRRKVIP